MPMATSRPLRSSTELLTVAAKRGLTREAVGELTRSACTTDDPYVVELRGTDGSSLYIGSLTCASRGSAWIGLGPENATWLHRRLRPGDTLAVAIRPRD
ncbi:hypothetical protein [Streptomyces thermoalcalitolerans]